jgi:hypothetical protein
LGQLRKLQHANGAGRGQLVGLPQQPQIPPGGRGGNAQDFAQVAGAKLGGVTFHLSGLVELMIELKPTVWFVIFQKN